MRGERNLKKSVVVFFCMLLFSMLLCLTASAEDTVKVKYNGTLDFDSANSVYQMVNQERSSRNLTKLVSNAQLQSEAMSRAVELAAYYSHTRPNGEKGSLIISNRKGWYGENIAVGYTSSEAVMTGWMNSEGHRANILNTKYTQIGVGCFWHNGIYYWVQLFNGNTTSGTLSTGTLNVVAEVDVLPSFLNLFVRQKTSTSSTFSLNENATKEIYAASKNAGWSSGSLILRADSPALSWSSTGGIAVNSNQTSVSVQGQSAGAAFVTVSCGSQTATASITVEHVPGTLSCTGGQSCTVCGKLLVAAPGHKPGKAATCTQGQSCTVCGILLKTALGHNYTAATCQTPAICTRCNNVKAGYSAHKWSSWNTISKATIYAAKKQSRKCSVCGTTEQRTVGTKLQQVTLVRFTKKASTLLAGKSATLKVSVSPANAANTSVVWSSSHTKYATVSQKGVVKAKTAGAGKSVTITAKAADGSGKKVSCVIKIKGAVKKIKLKASQSTVKAGKSVKIAATVTVGKGGSKSLKWTSSNTKYATVNSKGVVTAKKAGKGKTVTITAKAKDGSGKKAAVKIKIR